MKIQVAGPGCVKCKAAKQNVIKACSELGLNTDISHTYDVREYAKMGVSITPAIIVDGKVLVSGSVPTVDKLKKLLSEVQ